MFNSAQIQEVMDKNIALQGTQEINEEYIRKNLKNAWKTFLDLFLEDCKSRLIVNLCKYVM